MSSTDTNDQFNSNPIPQTPGVGYLTAVDAARRFNLTNDHIALLCRKGKVEGLLVGRVRYVSEESLKQYIVRAEEEKLARRKSLSEQMRRGHEAFVVVPTVAVETPVVVEVAVTPEPQSIIVVEPEVVVPTPVLALPAPVVVIGPAPVPLPPVVIVLPEPAPLPPVVVVMPAPAPLPVAAAPAPLPPVFVVSEIVEEFFDTPVLSPIAVPVRSPFFDITLRPVFATVLALSVTLGAAQYASATPVFGVAKNIFVASVTDMADEQAAGYAWWGGVLHSGATKMPTVAAATRDSLAASVATAHQIFVASVYQMGDDQAAGYEWWGNTVQSAIATMPRVSLALRTPTSAGSYQTPTAPVPNIKDVVARGTMLGAAITAPSVHSVVATTTVAVAPTPKVIVTATLPVWVQRAPQQVVAYVVGTASQVYHAIQPKTQHTVAMAQTSAANVWDAWITWLAAAYPQQATAIAVNQVPAKKVAAITPTYTFPSAATIRTTTGTTAAITTTVPKASTVLTVAQGQNYITKQQLADSLNQLENSLRSLIYSQQGSGAQFVSPQVAANGNGVLYGGVPAPVNTISSATVHLALTASDIPALNYFPATSTIAIGYGGTGTSTMPTYGKLLLGNAQGGYDLVATSSLGIATISGSASTTLLSDSNTWTAPTTTFIGNIGITGNIVPSANNTYSLGSSIYMWRDLFVGPGSIYVNGQEVLHTDPSHDVNVTADLNQNLILQTSGTGDVQLNPTGTGVIYLKGNVLFSGGKTFNTSDNSATTFTDGVVGGNVKLSGNTIVANNTNGSLELDSAGLGAVYVNHGNFGVGTTSPLVKLDVYGDATISGSNRYLNFGGATGSTGYGLRDNNGTLEFKNSGGSWTGIGTGGGGGNSFSYLFPSNATTTGLGIFASTTIGDGTQTGGLTISGGATTTGSLLVGGTLATASFGKLAVNGSVVFGTDGNGYLSTNAAGNYVELRSISNSANIVLARGGGNIGVGTSTPQSQLSIQGLTANGSLRITGATGAYGGNLILEKTKDGSVTDSLGKIAFYNNGVQRAEISSYQSEAANTSADLRFLTTANGASLVERMRITTTGNLGVGSTSPLAKLSVHANNGDTNTMLFTIASSTSNSTSTLFSVSNTGNTNIGGNLTVSGTQIKLGNPAANQSGLMMPSNSFFIFSDTLTGTGPSAANIINNFNNFTGLLMRRTSTGTGNFIEGQDSSGVTQFLINNSGGLLALASSTIGDGTQTGGLTINGGATTTGNAVVSGLLTAGTINVTDSTIPANGIYLSNSNTLGFAANTTLRFFITGNAFNSNNANGPSLANLAASNIVPTLIPNKQSTNTGIGAQGVGNLSLIAGGTEIVRVTSSGLLSFASSTIGDGTQTGGLTINGGATTTGNAYIAGNLGIGITSPAVPLHVVGTSFFNNVGNTEINLASAGSNYGKISNNTTGTWSLGYGSSLTNIGTSVLSWNSSGNVGIGTTSPINLLSLQKDSGNGPYLSLADGNRIWAVGNNGSDFVIKTTGTGNGSAVETNPAQLTINTSGNVGIGTSTPNTKLNIVGVDAAGTINETTAGMTLISGSGNAQSLRFYTDNSLAYSAIQSVQRGIGLNSLALNPAGGNVGIGTSSPLAKLQIENGNPGITFTPNARTAAIIDGSNFSGTTLSIIAPTTGKAGFFLGDPGNETRGQITFDNATGALNFTVGGGAHTFTYSNGGNLSLSSTSPFANLSIHANSGDTNRTLFAIGSSTSNSTTTLFTVTNSGNVGIGVNNPTNLLSVGNADLGFQNSFFGIAIGNTSANSILKVGQDSTHQLQFRWDWNATAANAIANLTTYGNSNPIRIDASSVQLQSQSGGNVGIGTTSPFATLSVVGNGYLTGTLQASNVLITASSTIGDGTQAGGLTINGGATTTGNAYIAGNLGVGVTSITSGAKLEVNGSINATQIWLGTATSLARSGSNLVLNSTNTANSGIIFDTTGSTERARIDGTTGNFGIGTTSPTRLLTVNGNAQFGDTISTATTSPLNVSFGGTYGTNTSGNVGNLKWDLFTNGSTGNRYGIGMSLNLMEYQAGLNGQHAFFVNQGTEAMRILSNGNVGIGTTSPYLKLSVAGDLVAANITATGTLQVSGGIAAGANISTVGSNIYVTNGTVLGSDGSGNGVIRNYGVGSLRFTGTNNNARADLLLTSAGNLGVGSTSPLAKLSVHANATDTNTTLFAIGSSTSNSTTTLFSISNTGAITASALANLSCLGTDSAGNFQAGSCVGGSGAFSWTPTTFGSTNSNATSTLIGFNAGIYALASSTIGNGSQAGGLTISGGATTTGNAYFGGSVGIGTSNPTQKLHISGSGTINAVIESTNTNLAAFNLRSGTADLALNLLNNQFSLSGGASDNVTLSFNASDQTNQLRLINSNGNVGLSTSTPFAKLSVHANSGDTNTTLFAIASSTTNSTSTLFSILNSGNVGINTANPAAPLTIVSSGQGSNTTGFSLLSTTSAQVAAIYDNAQSGGTGVMRLYRSGVVGIQLNANGDSYFNPSTGNFGIGTTSPNNKLVVNANFGTAAGVRLTGINAGTGIFADNGNISGIFSLTRQDTVNTADLSIAAFGGIGFKGGSQSYNNAVASNFAMYLTPTGSVGIGTTTPSGRLDVVAGSNQPAAIFYSDTAGRGLRVGTTDYVYGGTVGSFLELGLGTGSGTTYSKLNAWNGNSQSGNLVLNSTGGNVGIGTTTPGSLFTVSNSNNGNLSYNGTALSILASGGTSTGGGITFTPIASVGAPVLEINAFSGAGVASIDTNSSGFRTLQIYNKAAGGFQTVFAGGTGSNLVGIGTTSPFAPLSVHANSGDTNTTLFAIGSSTSNSTTTLFSVDNTGAINAANGNFAIDSSGRVGIGSVPNSGYSLLASGKIRSAQFQVTGSGGGVTSPAFTASGAQTTGMFISSDPSVAFSVSGSEIGRFTSNGLGVGTTSPFANLSIHANSGSTNTTLFAIGSSTASATTTLFKVDNVGNVTVTGPTGSQIQLTNGSVLVPGSGSFVWTGRSRITSSADGNLVLSNNSITDFNLLQFGGTTSSFPAFGRSGTNLYVASADGSWGTNLGVGTTTPYAKLTVWGGTTGNAFEVASNAGSASTTILQVSNAGVVSIGASTLGVPSGIFTVDASSSTTTISNLSVGNLTFDTDAGMVQLSDIPLSSGPAAGTIESQSLSIGGTPTLTVYGENDGSGGVQNLRVSVGTTTPYSKLSVWGSGTGAGQLFELTNNASTTIARFLDNGTGYFAGNIGVGTTSPFAKLSIAANNGDTATTLFAIGSSTASATTTLFTITNTGNVGIGNGSPISQLANTTSGVVDNTNSNIGVNTSGITWASSGTGFVAGFQNTNPGIGTNSNGLLVKVAASDLATYALSVVSNALSTNLFNVKANGSVGVGTSTPWAQLSINPSGITGPAFAVGSSTATSFVITSAGDVGVGTSSPLGNFDISVTGGVSKGFVIRDIASRSAWFDVGVSSAGQIRFNAAGGATLAAGAASIGRFNIGALSAASNILSLQGVSGQTGNLLMVDSNASGTTNNGSQFIINSLGYVGIATTSPYALLTVGGGNTYPGAQVLFAVASSTNTATSTFLTLDKTGYLAVGAGQGGTDSYGHTVGNSAVFSVDASSSTTTISNLSVGNLAFDLDAGVVNLSDIPLDSSVAAGVIQSQSIAIGGTPIFTVYGEADGLGAMQNGRVGIGTTTPYYVLDVASTTGAGAVARFTNATGNCTINPTNSALSCSSDERLKHNINSLGSTTLEQVMNLNPVTYNWNTEATSTENHHTGFIAQMVQKIFPDLVSTDGSGFLTLNYAGFVPYIVSAIQELYHTVQHFAEEFTTKKLCVADDSGAKTCITKSQLDALLQQAGQTAAAASSAHSADSGQAGTSSGGGSSGDSASSSTDTNTTSSDTSSSTTSSDTSTTTPDTTTTTTDSSTSSTQTTDTSATSTNP